VRDAGAERRGVAIGPPGSVGWDHHHSRGFSGRAVRHSMQPCQSPVQ
jgi:hypothetical protein